MNEYEKRFEEVTGKKFPAYFKEYNPKLIKYLTNNYTKNEEKSKEYSQMAFIQALNKIDSYNIEKSKVITWITTIAINYVIKDWKDAQRVESVSLDVEVQDTPGFINIIKQDDGEIEKQEHEENVRKCEAIYDIIKTLPEKYKKVMVMREIQNMRYKDIAETVRKEIKTVVKNKVHQLQTPEDFFSLDLENTGTGEIKILFTNGDKSYSRVVRPHHSFFIVREELDWDRSSKDIFEVLSNDSECSLSYVTTTNLSTIKSQIKKGRSLIRKKVRPKFKNLEK